MARPARRHLFELMDQPWWPRALRDGATGYLQALLSKERPFEVALPALSGALSASDSTQIVDLCSGGAGPWLTLLPALRAESGRALEILLTDLYPNEDARALAEGLQAEGLRYEPEPVDALALGAERSGLRTIVNGLHHFRPEDARRLLADAVAAGQPIAVLELLQRTWADVLAALAVVPLSVLVTVPRIRPLRAATLALTYLLPLLPAAVAWDTLISTLRCYTPDELLELAQSVPGSQGYVWAVETHRTPRGLPVTYLTGYPAASAPSPRDGQRVEAREPALAR